MSDVVTAPERDALDALAQLLPTGEQPVHVRPANRTTKEVTDGR